MDLNFLYLVCVFVIIRPMGGIQIPKKGKSSGPPVEVNKKNEAIDLVTDFLGLV